MDPFIVHFDFSPPLFDLGSHFSLMKVKPPFSPPPKLAFVNLTQVNLERESGEILRRKMEESEK